MCKVCDGGGCCGKEGEGGGGCGREWSRLKKKAVNFDVRPPCGARENLAGERTACSVQSKRQEASHRGRASLDLGLIHSLS